jgi:CrcB protein
MVKVNLPRHTNGTASAAKGNMDKLLLVFVGGGVGSMARYLLNVGATKSLGFGWPYGTFAANVFGGFAMGFLVSWLAHRGGADQERWRLLIGVGVLGGFTTFSTFSMETALMIQRRDYGPAAVYAAASVILAIGGVFMGLLAARRIFA